MSGGAEKERLIAFKNRIKQLELQLEEKTSLLDQYEAMGNAADCNRFIILFIILEKIDALNKIHSDKIRSLMNSIQLLKKENAQLKALQKEHKRSILIEQLNQEIHEQEIVIEALKKVVNNDASCDNAIIKALNEGPPKIKALTREELKIENKKLTNQILTLQQQLKKSKGGTGDAKNLEESEVSQQSKSTKSNKSQVTEEPSKLDANETLIRKIEELKNENEELRLNLKAEEEIRIKYEEVIEKRGEEITEMKSAKTDYFILSKKYEQLQSKLEVLKAQQVGKDIFQINKDLEMEEIQIINKAQGGKLQVAEKNLKMEIENLATQLETANRDREDMQQDYTKMVVRYDELHKRFNELQQKFILARDDNNKLKSDIANKVENYQKIESDLKAQLADQGKKLSAKETELIQAKLRIEKLEALNDELTLGLRDLETRLVHLSKDQFFYLLQESPDENELEINKQIQQILRKQDIEKFNSEDPAIQKKFQGQREYYENTIRDLQKKMIGADKQKAENLSDISSNVSKLIEKADEQNIPDDMNSDVSGSVLKKQQLYGGHYGLLQNEKLEDMNSNIESLLDSEEQKIDFQEYQDLDSKVSLSQSMVDDEHKLLQAPKPQKKQNDTPHLSQMNSSINSMLSLSQTGKKQNDINDMSSRVSQASKGSAKSPNLSQVSSNISKLSQGFEDQGEQKKGPNRQNLQKKK